MAIPSEYEWFKKVNDIYIGNQNFYEFTTVVNQDWGQSYSISPYDYTWTGIVYQGTDYKLDYAHENANAVWLSCYSPIIRIDITTIGVDYPRVTYSNANLTRPFADGQYTYKFSTQNNNMTYQNYPSYQLFPPASFETLDDALEYLYSWFTNITLYVDGELWVQAGPTQYSWQSVPSISGKNGILSLVTLDSESINDGEPVSGAAVSVFDQNPVSGNNVKDIVDGNTPLIPSAVDVTAAFIISNPPVGELASRILAAKKDSIPESIEDADKTVSISANASNVTMPGLDENSQYYFAIFVADAVGDTAVSDPKDIYTSADEGWLFDYTGEIQTFVAPKTGIYQLETWGAQGGDATDGTLTARGGYGAYAVGEVFLTQGDTLYINVGGQNGYGGGGKILVTENIPISIINKYYISSNSGGQIPYEVPTTYPDIISYLGTDYCIVIGDTNKKKLDVENDYIKYDNDSYSCSTGEMIPIPHKVIRNVKFKYKKISSSIPAYWWFDFMLMRINTETGAWERGLTITDDQSQSASSDWVSVDYNCNFEANYIHIWGVTGKWYVKDLQITYEQ